MKLPPRGEYADETQREEWIANHRPNIPTRWKNAKLTDFDEEIQKDVLSVLDHPERGMYIYGGTGSGKTHLSGGFFNYICDKQSDLMRQTMKSTAGKWPIFFNVSTLLSEIKKDFERSPEDKVDLESMLSECVSVVILDDIGVEKVTGWVEETLYRIINTRYEKMLPTVYTSNLSVEALGERLNERIASRIEGSCDVLYLGTEDLRKGEGVKVLKS